MVARKTVQAALDLGAEGVLVHSNACLNRRRFEPMPALKAFGGDTLISDIPKTPALPLRRAKRDRRRRLETSLPRRRRAAADRAERVGPVAVKRG